MSGREVEGEAAGCEFKTPEAAWRRVVAVRGNALEADASVALQDCGGSGRGRGLAGSVIDLLTEARGFSASCGGTLPAWSPGGYVAAGRVCALPPVRGHRR
jgi:hypothetical protein